EDIKKECKKLFDERKSYCVNKAHFSLDDKEEPVVVLAGLPKKRDVSFQNFESREGTKDEIKQLIEKDEGKVVACNKVPIDSDRWRYECYKWERNEKGELVLMSGRAPPKTNYSKNYIAWKFKMFGNARFVGSKCTKMRHWGDFKMIACSSDNEMDIANLIYKGNDALSYGLSDRVFSSAPGDGYKGYLYNANQTYVLTQGTFEYSKFKEKKTIGLGIVSNGEIINVYQKKSGFSYPLIH